MADSQDVATPTPATTGERRANRALGCLSVLAVGIVLGGLAAWGAWVACLHYVPRTYTTAAYLRVVVGSQRFRPRFGAREFEEYEVFKRTQANLIKSRYVVTRALQVIETQGVEVADANVDKTSRLMRDLDVSFPGDNEILQVAITEPDAKTATTIVNAAVDSYLKKALLTKST